MASTKAIDAKQWLAGLLVDFIEGHHLGAFVLLCVCVLAVVYAVFEMTRAVLRLRRDTTGQGRDQAELRKADLDNMQRLHEKEALYEKQQEIFNLQLSALVDAFGRQDINDAVKLREEAIATYCQDYLGALGRYLDFCGVAMPRRQRRSLLRDQVVRELETSQDVLSVVNEPFMLTAAARAPLRLSQQTFRKVWAFCDAETSWWQFRLRRRIQRIREALPRT